MTATREIQCIRRKTCPGDTVYHKPYANSPGAGSRHRSAKQFVLQLQFASGSRSATCVDRNTSDKHAEEVLTVPFERLIKSVWQFTGEAVEYGGYWMAEGDWGRDYWCNKELQAVLREPLLLLLHSASLHRMNRVNTYKVSKPKIKQNSLEPKAIRIAHFTSLWTFLRGVET